MSEPHEAPNPKGSPAMLILMVVVLGPALLVGQLLGAGNASIIGGFVALFTLISSMGGVLWADLRRLAAVGPLIAFGAVVPRLLSEVSTPAAFALTTVVIFGAGLLPLLGRRYDAVALGAGMGTLFGYAMPIQGSVEGWRLLVAAVAGIIVAALLRVILGVKDPEAPAREAVADLFVVPDADFAAAFDVWSSHRPVRWLGTALVSAGRYRLARRVLTARAARGDNDGEIVRSLEAAEEHATMTAETIRAKEAPTNPHEEKGVVAVADHVAASSVAVMAAALESADAAVRGRDLTRAVIPRGARARISAAAVRTALWSGSVQVRHALRSAVAVLLALLVSTTLERGNPLLPTLLMTTFAVVQVSWRATWTKVGQRFAGLAIGGVLVVLIVLFLPEDALLPVSLVGLAVGMWFITARPAVGAAGIIVMSVGINTELRDLVASDVIIDYVVLTLAALLIGGVVGFLVVPAWRPPTLSVRVDAAVGSAADLLGSLAATTGDEGVDDVPAQIARALAASQQLVPDRDRLTTEQVESLESVRSSLQDLIHLTLFLFADRGIEQRAALGRAAASLRDDGDRSSAENDEPQLEAIVMLADETVSRRDRFLALAQA